MDSNNPVKSISDSMYDISGVINLQKNLIKSLSNIGGNETIIKNLSASLTDFYNNFKDFTTSDVTERQKDMIKIVETEKERLEKKKTSYRYSL